MRRPLLLSAIVALSSALARADIPELPRALAPSAKPAAFEPAPIDAVRQGLSGDARSLIDDLGAWFEANPAHRLALQVDRPLYRPGDTVQVKVWDLTDHGLAPTGGSRAVDLVDPRGTLIATLQADPSEGARFALDPNAGGGAWTVRTTNDDGTALERAFTVASFEKPRIAKVLEFGADSYRPGDPVEAAISLTRTTGEPVADAAVTARVLVQGVAMDPLALRTDARGEVTVAFRLPAELSAPDVMLTVTVDDGGAPESLARAVPVALDRVDLALHPEGGDLVAGLASRVYFEATDATGAPLEVRGQVVDETGAVAARFATWVDGRGRFTFTPAPGHSYSAVPEHGAPVALPATARVGTR
jgi:hypothetical protein